MSVAVIIPCYRVRRHILRVITGVLDRSDAIYVVDDRCPEGTADYVEREIKNSKVKILRLGENIGVGGATLAGYAAAINDGHEILVKMDGDDQMDPAYLPALTTLIMQGRADYSKGNRFFSPRFHGNMPKVRLFGNGVLSLLTKLSSGYWDIMDPTNGYIAVHARILPLLEVERLDKRFFFESDMLFRLGLIRAVVRDVPIPSRYADEVSNLIIKDAAFRFLRGHILRFLKRVAYQYFIRDVNVGSVQLMLAVILIACGGVFGLREWISAAQLGREATSGTVMISALPIIIGFQLLLASIMHDVTNAPREPVHPLLVPKPTAAEACPTTNRV